MCLPCGLKASSELISNDKFSDDGASWELTTDSGVNIQMSVENVDNEPALCVEVNALADVSGSNPDDIKRVGLRRFFGEVESGRDCRLVFKAKAAQDTSIVASISSKVNPSQPLWRTQIQIPMEWKEFTFTFQCRESVSDAVLSFARMGESTNKYWFKDIVLTID